jgi:F-box protein 18 (helicase)
MAPSPKNTGKEKLAANLTEEQKAIIGSVGNIRINAVAGSGKTTTIIHYAASRPKSAKILYLAFNRSVKVEAKKRFMELGLNNVQVETAHSLAYKHLVMAKGYKVSANGYKPYELTEILDLKGTGEKLGEFILASHISKFIAYFCNTDAGKIQELNYLDIVADKKARSFASKFYRHIELGARQLLAKMYHGEIEVTHDFYLKMFQLSKPVLHYDHILFDEGQDASPAMLDIFLNQKGTKVIVGDTHQQIYAWRHAVNSLGKVDFADLYLSASFRFGPDIAHLAMEILSWKRHLQDFKPVLISGLGKPSQTAAKATIARTNLGLLVKAFNFITANSDVKYLYFEGNINSYTYADEGASLYDVLHLYNGRHGRIKDKLIRSMSNLKDLEEYIDKTEDGQLGILVSVVKEYGNEIPSLINLLKSLHVADDEKEKAEMIFSTVHRSKGMEYDIVELADDFITEKKMEKLRSQIEKGEEIDPAQWNDEINMLYVAITRTKGLLHIPESMLPKDHPKSASIHITKTKEEDSEENSAPEFSGARGHKGRDQKTDRPQSYREKRMMQKNSRERWTPETDAVLKEMYYKGIKLTSIAEHFRRHEYAVLSRLRKIGCVKFE